VFWLSGIHTASRLPNAHNRKARSTSPNTRIHKQQHPSSSLSPPAPTTPRSSSSRPRNLPPSANSLQPSGNKLGRSSFYDSSDRSRTSPGSDPAVRKPAADANQDTSGHGYLHFPSWNTRGSPGGSSPPQGNSNGGQKPSITLATGVVTGLFDRLKR
jgi:hypothetical protein